MELEFDAVADADAHAAAQPDPAPDLDVPTEGQARVAQVVPASLHREDGPHRERTADADQRSSPRRGAGGSGSAAGPT